MNSLKISKELVSSRSIAIGVDCDLKLLQAQQGDFVKGEKNLPPLASKILALRSIQRVVIYGKDPRIIEVMKTDNAGDFQLAEIFDIIAKEFSDGSYELVDQSLISTEAATREACG